jgi:bis(5'-nucleosidyl)-tetraphosphatase
MPRENSCGAVVFRENGEREYLLLHYEAGHWDFVKGNIEPNESEKGTVIRELREETGILRARFIDDFREEISYFYRRGGKTIFKEVIFFLIETKDTEVKLSYEHIGYEWLTYQHALKRLTHGNAKKVLRRANTFLKRILYTENKGHSSQPTSDYHL